jgi:RES domain-containing protein
MIVTALDAVAYRVHDPQWSFAPISGAGAGLHGGRANRPGINALYLSLELETALAEYRQLDILLQPSLMVSYRVMVGPVVDFRNGFSNAWDALWQDFYCDWRKLVFNDGIEPPSWVLGDQVLATGAKDILFKSIITGGTNVVLYNDALTGSDIIDAYDPNHVLPTLHTR